MQFKVEMPLTYAFIVMFIIVFLYELYIGIYRGTYMLEKMFSFYGFSPAGFIKGQWWTVITNMFIHAGPEHLILNMVALFFFGGVIERELGKIKFLTIFFLSGIFGNLVIIIASFFGLMPADMPTVGASAAIFGLLGAAMLVKPDALAFYPYIIPVPIILVALIYAMYNVMSFLLVISSGIQTEISYISHIGGLLVGIGLGFREEGEKKGFRMLLLILLILILLPFLWKFIEMLQVTNWMTMVVPGK